MKTFKSYVSTWNDNASINTHWAVLSDDDVTDWDQKEFYATGEREIQTVMSFLEQNDLSPNKKGCSLDFGCGVGRLTSALASHFKQSVGIDISKVMIGRAKKDVRKKNVEFILNPHPDLTCLGDRSFDFIYSNIVFQHIPKANQLNYLREIGGLLCPGGIAAIQIPSKRIYRTWYDRLRGAIYPWVPIWAKRSIAKALGFKVSRATLEMEMEMNVIPSNRVAAVAKEVGLEIAAIGYTNSTSVKGDDFCFFPEMESAIQSSPYLSPMYIFKKVGK